MNSNDRSIVALVMLAHGMVHTYELSIPIFVSIWLTEFDVLSLGFVEVGVTEATLGLVVTAGYGLFGVGALPGGVLVDRVGSARLITLCLFGMAGSFVLLGLAPNLLVVALALLLWGAAASVYHPAGLTLLSKGVTERGTGFAYHGIAGNVGTGLGPLLTAILLLFVDWTVVSVLLALPALAAGAYAMRARFDETAAVDAVDDSVDDSDGDSVGDDRAGTGVASLAEFGVESRRLFAGAFALVFVVVMASGLYYRGVLTFLPNLLESLPGFEPIPLTSALPAPVTDALGVQPDSERAINPERYFYSGLLIVGVLGQYLGGKLTDRIPVEAGLAGGFGLLALLALVFLPAANAGLAPLLVVGAVLGCALFLVQPFYQATVAEYSPAGTRGLSYGFTYLGVFGVGALGGAIAGTILTYATPAALFLTLAAFGATGSGVGVYLLRRRRAV
ncbi:MFS transporter [Halobellus limi]|uniref:MFS transporter n=2 Tax=Halobellus limi TaxID=699433 RepID=A0A1H6AM18_9EURY|nr:MFS transporter [Halobellus limi]SEG48806.1 Sugar phosphate permease [Halobellus limi]